MSLSHEVNVSISRTQWVLSHEINESISELNESISRTQWVHLTNSMSPSHKLNESISRLFFRSLSIYIEVFFHENTGLSFWSSTSWGAVWLKESPPPRGDFLFGWFPNEKPRRRGPPWKNPQFLELNLAGFSGGFLFLVALHLEPNQKGNLPQGGEWGFKLSLDELQFVDDQQNSLIFMKRTS